MTPSPGYTRPVVYICVNGILSLPGDSQGWTDRAVTWLNLHTPGKAEKFEYACGVITRRLRQNRRAEAIARMCEFYSAHGFEIVFIGHSNGCDLIERVLGKIYPLAVRSMHLFAAASDGVSVSDALRKRQLGAAYLYGSRNDGPLKIAGLSKKLFGWARMGYGDLGRRVEEFAVHNPRTFAREDGALGHSSWFTRGPRFEETMSMILKYESFA